MVTGIVTWQGLRHAEHGGITLVPAGIPFPALEGRGWEPIDTPEGVDPTNPDALKAALDAQAEADRAEAVKEAKGLTGPALAEALAKAGIDGKGLTADEKRARLAEHESGQPSTDNNNENEGAE